VNAACGLRGQRRGGVRGRGRSTGSPRCPLVMWFHTNIRRMQNA